MNNQPPMTLLRDPGRYQEKQKPPIITHYSCAAVSFVSGYFLCKRQKNHQKNHQRRQAGSCHAPQEAESAAPQLGMFAHHLQRFSSICANFVVSSKPNHARFSPPSPTRGEETPGMGPNKTPGDEAGRRQPEMGEKETYMDL